MKVRNYLPQDSSEEGLFNLTPLVDVVFVVLITFMLIAPLLELDHVDLAAKPHQIAQTQAQSDIHIYVYRDNSIWIDKKQIKAEQLVETLKRVRLKNPQAIPKVFHHKQAYFETYQTIKNALEASGFENMDVVLKTE